MVDKNRCCGADCWKEGTECEGDVKVIDEERYGVDDYYWIHSCKKHADEYMEKHY